jgi:hypothetical protein
MIYSSPVQGADVDSSLDTLLAPDLRHHLEERFWRPIEAEAKLEVLREDPLFLDDPTSHPGLFPDHGVVHVRDIASGFVEVATTVNGVLLSRRLDDRQRFILSYGVLVTYLHDIGMRDPTPNGRRIHAVYAAHVAFGSQVDDLVARVLEAGQVRKRLELVDRHEPFGVSLDVVLRELLSLAMAHSKSTVPAAVLDHRPTLRRLLQRAVFTGLDELRRRGETPAPDDASPVRFSVNHQRYADPAASFAWLVASHGAQADLADDAVDAIRVLPAADALRQRGTDLRTSGGYEICIDAATGRAVHTLRSADGGAVYLLSYHDERGAGEANIRVATITPHGHLRVAFHRGSYLDDTAARHAVVGTARVIGDIQADVIPSFSGAPVPDPLVPPSRRADEMLVQLERPSDRPAFADEVAEVLVAAHPELAGRVIAVADVEAAEPAERERYHRGTPIDPGGDEALEILARMAEHGAKVDGIEAASAFADVCRAGVQPGEVVFALGSSPSFVYVPTGHGLTARPGGGYQSAPIMPWVPVGTTGVVRRAERNSEILADRHVDVIMIPGELYARVWFQPYTPRCSMVTGVSARRCSPSVVMTSRAAWPSKRWRSRCHAARWRSSCLFSGQAWRPASVWPSYRRWAMEHLSTSPAGWSNWSPIPTTTGDPHGCEPARSTPRHASGSSSTWTPMSWRL